MRNFQTASSIFSAISDAYYPRFMQYIFCSEWDVEVYFKWFVVYSVRILTIRACLWEVDSLAMLFRACLHDAQNRHNGSGLAMSCISKLGIGQL